MRTSPGDQRLGLAAEYARTLWIMERIATIEATPTAMLV